MDYARRNPEAHQRRHAEPITMLRVDWDVATRNGNRRLASETQHEA